VGLLPTYKTAGVFASLLLALCRFGQGIGLGGEWGGAVLLATENAPPGKRAWYGMFPQLGAPVGFFFSSAVFLVLSKWLTPAQFLSFGWRLPFLASGVLVLLGLYVRLTITETPVFAASMARREAQRVPILSVVKNHFGVLFAGILTSLSAFVAFYLMIVFTLTWATTALGYSKPDFLKMQLTGVLFFALAIPAAALLAEKGRKPVMLAINVAIAAYGFVFAPLFQAGHTGAQLMLILGLSLMGLVYGPLGTVLSELFPTPVRYTGSSLAFSIAGIVGASLAPYIALWLAKNYGLKYVGYYLTASAVLTIIGLLAIRETKHSNMAAAIEAP
jgi:MFS family permease